MKIDICGWYGRKNIGDQAFQAAHHYIFRKHNISFVTPPSKCGNPDIIVLGGGAVASPFYFSSFTQTTCPKYALGISISYMSEMDLLAKMGFKHIYLRDAFDVEPLRQKVTAQVDAIPDLAFFHRPSGEDVASRYRSHRNKRPLGVMLTDYVNPAIDRSYEKFSARAHSFVVKMAAELDKLSRQGWDVFLIPLSTGGYGNDIRINLDIAAYMRETPIVILDTLSPQQCLDLVFQMDLNICMKFHAHLFSMIAGVPFVSIDFTRKVDLFLEAHDLRKTICAKFQENEFDTSRFAETVDTTLAEDKMFREQFVETSENYYRRLHEITGTIRRDWLGESS